MTQKSRNKNFKKNNVNVVSRLNNNNSDLTKELDKDESCLKKLRPKHPKNILFGT